MATSWIIVSHNAPQRKIVDLRTLTRKGVLAAVRRHKRRGARVIAAYLGGPRPCALCAKVYQEPRAV